MSQAPIPVGLNGLPLTHDALLIPMGVYNGITSVNKFGRNTAVASGATEEIWGGSAVYSFPATALMTSISQTTDQTALRGATVEITGLDADWNEVIQTAILDATLTTTVVTLATPLIRCFRMKLNDATLSTSDIRVHNAAETQDYAVIEAGTGQTQMAIYTVPANHTAYMTGHYATYNPGGGAPTSLIINLWARDNFNSYEKRCLSSVGLAIGGTSALLQKFNPYKRFDKQCDIFIDATTETAAADVSAGFDLILVDNDRKNL